MDTDDGGTYRFHVCVQLCHAKECTDNVFAVEGMQPNAQANGGFGRRVVWGEYARLNTLLHVSRAGLEAWNNHNGRWACEC